MDQDALVYRLLEMTQAIEHAAALSDWPEAARLMEERAPLFYSLTAEQTPAALELIHRIRSIDATIAQDAREAQAELAVEYQAAMNRIQATKQYHRAATL